MVLALSAVGVLASVPAAQACSLAHYPFGQAQWVDGRLHFVDGDRLLRVDGATETTLATGYLLSCAPHEGGLAVAGQDGLGADCSGADWLRLYVDGRVESEQDDEARVFPHGDQALVWRDDRLEPFSPAPGQDAGYPVPRDTWLVGATHEGKPVYQDRGDLVLGDVAVAIDGFADDAAHSADATAAVHYAAEGGAVLTELRPDGSVVQVSWPVAQGGVMGVVWADGWAVAAGERAYFLRDGSVLELGPAIAVGARGDQVAVFTQSGYTLYDDGEAVEAWTRGTGGLWTPTSTPSGTSQPVDATGQGVSASGAPPVDDGDGLPIPALPVAPLVAMLALAGVAMRRRR